MAASTNGKSIGLWNSICPSADANRQLIQSCVHILCIRKLVAFIIIFFSHFIYLRVLLCVNIFMIFILCVCLFVACFCSEIFKAMHIEWLEFLPLDVFSLADFYIIFFCCSPFLFAVRFVCRQRRLQPVANISTHLLCLAYFIMIVYIYKCCSHSSATAGKTEHLSTAPTARSLSPNRKWPEL